jgi:uncharacterized protein YggU (UPF0235/DUF167 family)
MDGVSGPLRAVPGGVSVALRVTPGARAAELTVAADGGLRLRVAAPPVEGKANAAVLAFLAARLGVRPRACALASGERARDKVVLVRGVSVAEAAAALGVRAPPG